MMRRRPTSHHPHPVLPRVNLLSPASLTWLSVRVLQRRFLAAGVGLIVLIAVVGAVQHLQVAEARRLAAVEQAETSRLRTETQVLAPVRAFMGGVARQQETVETNMAGEITSSEVLEALLGAAPPGLRLEALTLTVATVAEAQADGALTEAVTSCPGPDPFNTRAVVGCVVLSGTAGSRAEVGEFVIGLGDLELFVEPFISTTTTADAAGVSFAGSVGLSRVAMSRRLDAPTGTVAREVRR
jgi:hypothetical protein